MTPTEHDDTSTGAAAVDVGAPDAGKLLDQVRGNAVRLVAETPGVPSSLHVRAGDVAVDMAWPDPGCTGAGPPATAAIEPPTPEPEPEGGYLIAQTVGVFYPAPEPGSAPFVSEGDTVVEGQQVGIIEAMKLMIPVNADRAGRIADVLKSHAEPVEYGDRLFGLHGDGTE